MVVFVFVILAFILFSFDTTLLHCRDVTMRRRRVAVRGLQAECSAICLTAYVTIIGLFCKAVFTRVAASSHLTNVTVVTENDDQPQQLIQG